MRTVAAAVALGLSGVATEGHDHLAVAVADSHPVQGLTDETLGPSWGLRLIDMTIAPDDLVALVERQGQAHLE